MSFAERKPVIEVIGDHLWPTVLLVGTAEVVALIVGIAHRHPGGLATGQPLRHRSASTARWCSTRCPCSGWACSCSTSSRRPTASPCSPASRWSRPACATPTRSRTGVDVLRHLVLPATTLALGLIAGNALIMRSSMVETLREDYITTARAKGLTRVPGRASPRHPQRAAADGHRHRAHVRLRAGRRHRRRGGVRLAGHGQPHRAIPSRTRTSRCSRACS